jgi:hypothetical protein
MISRDPSRNEFRRISATRPRKAACLAGSLLDPLGIGPAIPDHPCWDGGPLPVYPHAAVGGLVEAFEEVLDLRRHLLLPHGFGRLVDVHHHGPLEVRHDAGCCVQTLERFTSPGSGGSSAPCRANGRSWVRREVCSPGYWGARTRPIPLDRRSGSAHVCPDGNQAGRVPRWRLLGPR